MPGRRPSRSSTPPWQGRPERFVDLPWQLDTDRGAQETWWTFSYSRVLDAAGQVAGLFILTNETTGRVLADAALTESQAALEAALGDLRNLNATLAQQVEERTADRNAVWTLSSDMMLRCRFDGTITAVNPAWTEVLGWRPDELVGTKLIDVVHPGRSDPHDRGRAAAVRGREPRPLRQPLSPPGRQLPLDQLGGAARRRDHQRGRPRLHRRA